MNLTALIIIYLAQTAQVSTENTAYFLRYGSLKSWTIKRQFPTTEHPLNNDLTQQSAERLTRPRLWWNSLSNFFGPQRLRCLKALIRILSPCEKSTKTWSPCTPSCYFVACDFIACYKVAHPRVDKPLRCINSNAANVSKHVVCSKSQYSGWPQRGDV